MISFILISLIFLSLVSKSSFFLSSFSILFSFPYSVPLLFPPHILLLPSLFLSCLKVLAAAEISKKEDSREIGESPRAKIHDRLWHATSNLFNSRLKRLWQQMCRFSKFQYSVTQHKDVLIPHRRSPDLQRFKTCSQSQAVFSNTKSTY